MSDDKRTELRQKIGSIKKGGWAEVNDQEIFRTFGGDLFIFRGPDGGTKGTLDEAVEALAENE